MAVVGRDRGVAPGVAVGAPPGRARGVALRDWPAEAAGAGPNLLCRTEGGALPPAMPLLPLLLLLLLLLPPVPLLRSSMRDQSSSLGAESLRALPFTLAPGDAPPPRTR